MPGAYTAEQGLSMARTRFVGDAGLTVRMTTVMFLLGALFVGLVVDPDVALSAAVAFLIGIGGLGIAVLPVVPPTSSRCGRCGPARSRPSRRPSCTA